MKTVRIFHSAAVALLLLPLLFSPASAEKIKVVDLSEPAMVFRLVRSANGCEPLCAEWISAEGRIDAGTPKKFKAMLKAVKGKALPLVLSSNGGDVQAALAIGRLVRKAGLPVYVGRTVLAGCYGPDPLCDAGVSFRGMLKGRVFSAGAYCFSACPFILAGGTQRISAAYSLVGVHQIVTGYIEYKVQYRTEYQVQNGEKRAVGKQELGRKKIGETYSTKMSKALKKRLNVFWREMGVDQTVTDLMTLAGPKSMHIIFPADLTAYHLTTAVGMVENIEERSRCSAQKPADYCVNAADL